jgi:cytochrome c oxidase subunit 1
MLGAKDVAFPKLNLASWWLYVIGSIVAVSSIAFGGLDTGWTFYTPLLEHGQTAPPPTTPWAGSSPSPSAPSSSASARILTGVNFIVTIHKLRPKGMGWFRMPLFLWALYATSIIQILATPVLGITLLLLIAERASRRGHLRPGQGRRPGALPALLLVLQPPGGVHHDPARHGRDQRVIAPSATSTSSATSSSPSAQRRHRPAGLPRVGPPHVRERPVQRRRGMIFSVMTFAVAIPSAIKVFNWLATMYNGSIAH